MSAARSQGEGLLPDDHPGRLRYLSRSPHPYHRIGPKLPGFTDPTDRPSRPSQWPRTPSESGTEADDECAGVLRRLPAPPPHPRKGLRSGRDGSGSIDYDSGLPVIPRWPPFGRRTSWGSPRSPEEGAVQGAEGARERLRRTRDIEVLRRISETLLLMSVSLVVLLREDVRSVAWVWRKELLTHIMLATGLYALYPFRIRSSRYGLRPLKLPTFSIPSSFDPAPLLFPIFIPVLVSLSLPHHNPALVLPNILLALSSLPAQTIPLHVWGYGPSVSHWMVTLAPLIVSEHLSWDNTAPKPLALVGFDSEALALIFPLHQALIPTLDFLLTTSILPAELQLLTTALVNLFLFASSPQAEILKSLLWLGSMCIFASCRYVLRWEVALARIPSWKFRRSPSGSQSRKSLLSFIYHTLCKRISRVNSSDGAASDSDTSDGHAALKTRKTMHGSREHTPSTGPVSTADNVTTEDAFQQYQSRRRHTISTFGTVPPERVRTTPSGRRKRTMAPGLSSFLSMTVPQVQVRKWLYALYVYAAVLIVIMGPVRKYVSERALHGYEPFGWALGYLFGNLSWFRFWVLMWNLDHWIPLPAREMSDASCRFGWLQCLREGSLGQANARLLICLYCILIILTGLGVVFRLSSVTEVDTRRKVFHGMMVLMFIPTVYMDPAFCSLALALTLSIFLLLDLFRASQLPPISRPLTYFLAPYVDGRDHRGPVVVSHIFLLIGCSIPLWLSLADIPRTGTSPWIGWDVPTRDVSMASGLVCVGMGDAAASLVGRRFGRHKWLWGGGKSVEGSLAFAAAVSCGLVVARIRLSQTGLPMSGSAGGANDSWPSAVGKAVLAAGGASATEAILTGCNDNVLVPVVLWLLVRGLGL